MTNDTSAEKLEKRILELCSESEYGSWEFWSDSDSKTDKEKSLIVQAVVKLVSENLIYPTERRFVGDKSYRAALFDPQRLADEVTSSIHKRDINPETFYWFVATDKGKKLDIKDRS